MPKLPHINLKEPSYNDKMMLDDKLVTLFMECKEKGFTVRQTAEATRDVIHQLTLPIVEENKELMTLIKAERTIKAQKSFF